MEFFIPETKPSQTEAVYTGMMEALKEQLRWPITPRRIFKLKYIHDKKPWQAEVGQLERQGNRYQILAIFESNCYIVFTRDTDGSHGVTILVNKDEVTDIEDFQG